jgi:cysteine synthase
MAHIHNDITETIGRARLALAFVAAAHGLPLIRSMPQNLAP